MKYILPEPLNSTIGNTRYQCTLVWKNGSIISDESVSTGGQGTGPDPYTLLLASLASSTLITVRKYIESKGWDIPAVTVYSNLYQEINDEKTITIIDHDMVFTSTVPDEQKLELQEIARQSPLSKILEAGINVRTFVFREADTKQIHYANDEITVVWKPQLCQHSTRCFKQLPSVFDPKIRKWVNPNGAPADVIERQVKVCPSGALGFYYNKNRQ